MASISFNFIYFYFLLQKDMFKCNFKKTMYILTGLWLVVHCQIKFCRAMQVIWLKHDFRNWLFNFVQCLHFIMFTQIAISVNQGKESVLMGIVMYFCEYYVHPGICLVRSIQHHKTEPSCLVYRIIKLHQLVVNRQKIADNWTEVGSNNSNLINSQSTSIIAICTQIQTIIFSVGN